MLQKHELPVAREETVRVDTLHYSWQKLVALASAVSRHFISLQPEFKSELIENVKVFVEDCGQYYTDYKVVSDIFCFFILGG